MHAKQVKLRNHIIAVRRDSTKKKRTTLEGHSVNMENVKNVCADLVVMLSKTLKLWFLGTLLLRMKEAN